MKRNRNTSEQAVIGWVEIDEHWLSVDEVVDGYDAKAALAVIGGFRDFSLLI
jgi:hypothetical protein